MPMLREPLDDPAAWKRSLELFATQVAPALNAAC